MATLFAPGCFIETQPPPTFRYQCGGDDDCAEGEGCDEGLCQVRCSPETFQADCPADPGYAACFNGHCTHVCEPGKDRCSAPQSCITLPDELGGDAASFGFCGVSCQSSGCADGELCVGDVCVETCEETPEDPLPCGDAATCLGGVCIPNEALGEG